LPIAHEKNGKERGIFYGTPKGGQAGMGKTLDIRRGWPGF